MAVTKRLERLIPPVVTKMSFGELVSNFEKTPRTESIFGEVLEH